MEVELADGVGLVHPGDAGRDGAGIELASVGGDVVKQIQQWFPIANTGYLTDSFGAVRIRGIRASAPPFADATHAVLVLTAYVVVFVVISAVLVRRRDVTS